MVCGYYEYLMNIKIESNKMYWLNDIVIHVCKIGIWLPFLNFMSRERFLCCVSFSAPSFVTLLKIQSGLRRSDKLVLVCKWLLLTNTNKSPQYRKEELCSIKELWCAMVEHLANKARVGIMNLNIRKVEAKHRPCIDYIIPESHLYFNLYLESWTSKRPDKLPTKH